MLNRITDSFARLLLRTRRAILVATTAAVLVALAVYLAEQQGLIAPSFEVVGATAFFLLAAVFIVLGLLLHFAIEHLDEAIERAQHSEQALAEVNEVLEHVNQELEGRVVSRTRALELSAEVSRRLSTILVQEDLVTAVVNQLQSSFDYYHVHIYLLEREELRMAGGTGEAGRLMLAANHTLPLGKGLVGRAAEHNEPVLAGDVSLVTEWLPNPLLPDTRAELAVPISRGDEVLGVLDVQDDTIGALTDDDVGLIQSVANQVAVALQNSRLYEDAQRRGEELALVNHVVTEVTATLSLQESLEIVVRELVRATSADQARVALLDENGESLTIVAEAFDVARTASALGTKIPVEGNELTAEVLGTREAVLITDAQNNPRTAPVHALFREQGIETVLLLPIMAGQRVLGTLGIDILDKQVEFAEDELRLIETIVFQAATAIQNARLFEQVQEALAHSETLYGVAAQLNAATSLEEVLQALAEPTRESGLGSSTLYLVETDADDNPEWAELVAECGHTPDAEALSPGKRIYLPDFPLTQVWLLERDRPLFVEDVDRDARISKQTRALLQRADTRSLIVLPLTRGQRWLGLVVHQARKGRAIGERGRRLQTALRDQASLVLDRWLLTEEVEERATQLELLANIEAELSRASTEEEILLALLPAFGAPETLSTVSLDYYESDRGGQPEQVRCMALWRDGAIQEMRDARTKAIPVAHHALSRLVIEEPDELQFIPHVASDPRADDGLRRAAEADGAQAILAIPLFTGGDWYGSLTAHWRKSRLPSEAELFLLRQLVEPLIAAVASRRAALAQREALSETATLYRAAAEVNKARQYADIVEALRAYTILGAQSTILSLALLDTPWNQKHMPASLDVVAYWTAQPVEHEWLHFRLEEYPAAAHVLRADRAVFIEDVEGDPDLDQKSRRLFRDRFGATSVLSVPLRVGGQWIGHVNAFYPQPVRFTEKALQRMSSIIGQASVAVQNINLLEETNRLLANEQRQRRISETMLQATSRMSGVLQEEILRQLLLEEIYALVQPDSVALYHWRPETATLELESQHPVRRRKAEAGQLPAILHRNTRSPLWQVLDQGEPLLQQEQAQERYRIRYALPWFVGSEIAGVIQANYASRTTALREEEQASVEGIIQQAAIRLQNARLFAESELRATELAILNEMGQDLTALVEVQPILETVRQHTARLMDARNIYIALYHPEQQTITFPLFIEDGEREEIAPRQMGAGLTDYIIKERQSLLIYDDAPNRLREMGIDLVGTPATSWLGVPMMYRDQVAGVIAVQHPTIAALYDEHDQELLSAVASAAAISLQNAHLFAETQERAAETEALYEASRALNTAQSYEEILTALRQHTVLGQELSYVTASYFDRPWTDDQPPVRINTIARLGLLPPSAAAYEDDRFPPVALLQPDQVTVVEEVDSDPRLDDASRALYADGLRAASTIFVPLIVGGQWVGYLNAIYAEPRRFAEEDLDRLLTVAGQAAVAMQGIRLLEEARSRARREQILREVTTHIRSVSDVDLIMKTAAREVGRALGRETFVVLGDGEAAVHAVGKETEEDGARN